MVGNRRSEFRPRLRARPSVLTLGCRDHREFAGPRELLDATADVHEADSVEELVGRIGNRGDRYDLVLGCMSRPGVLASDFERHVVSAAPLVGRAVLLGSWCEGSLRTGPAWTDTERVYWYNFAPWWRANLDLWQRGRRPTWYGGAPIHASRTVASRGVVVVRACDWDSTATLMDTLATAGYTAVVAREGRRFPLATPIASGLWVGGQLLGDAQARLAEFTTQIYRRGGAGVIALLDFPRSDEIESARELGASVLGKPWCAIDLTSELSRLLEKCDHSERIAA